MPRKQSPPLVKASTVAPIVVHSRPVSLEHTQPAGNAERPIGQSIWRFGGAMIRHHRVWLGGSATIGLISTVYALAKSSVPAALLAVLVGLMFVVACFNAWREQYHTAITAEECIRQLHARIAELENPPIRAMVHDFVLWLGGGDLNGQEMWHWDVHFSLEIIPSLACPMTLSELCRIDIFANNSDEPIIAGNIKRYWRDNTLAALPLDVFESARFACEVSVSSPIGHEPPDMLVAKISMSDMRSKWTKQLVLHLRRDRSKLQPGWIAQTSSV